MDAKEITEDMWKSVETAIVIMALKIQSELILTTPVDTGWARSNWISAVGFSPPGTPGTNKSIIDTAAGLNWTMHSGPIYISNNVPYINRLNAGSSRQAPRNFVDKAIQAGIRKIDSKRIDKKSRRKRKVKR